MFGFVQVVYYNHDKYSLLIAILVAGITLYKDPALGILVGSVIGLLFFAEKVSRGSYEAVQNSRQTDKKIYLAKEKTFTRDEEFDILVYSIRGVLSSLSCAAHIDRLDMIENPIYTVVVRMREVAFIDIEGIEALDVIIETLNKKGVRVMLSGLSRELVGMMGTHSCYYDSLKNEGAIFRKTSLALESLGVPLRG